MSDVFVSYSKSDRAAAARIAQSLADRGLTVWWDREIAFGDSFDRVIERELAQAKSVIVLWSHASVESDWVRNEARRGLGRGVLIPLRIDAVEIPLEFSNVQFADLSDWQPGQPHEAFDRLVQRVSQVIQRPVSAGPAAGSSPRPSTSAAATPDAVAAARPRSTARVIGGVAVAAMLAVAGLWALFGGGQASPAPGTVPNVVGLSLADAQGRITGAGLQAIPQLAPNSNQPPDTVYATGPPGGQSIVAGGPVWLYHTAAAAQSSCARAAPPARLTASMKTNGVEVDGHCFYLANGGQSCSDFCRRLERSCEVDGLAMAARSVAACQDIVGALGGPGGLTYAQSGLFADDLAGCTYGDWGQPDSRWVQVMRRGNGDPTCDAVNADDARMRICACK